jgi:hypothetical protein
MSGSTGRAARTSAAQNAAWGALWRLLLDPTRAEVDTTSSTDASVEESSSPRQPEPIQSRGRDTGVDGRAA